MRALFDQIVATALELADADAGWLGSPDEATMLGAARLDGGPVELATIPVGGLSRLVAATGQPTALAPQSAAAKYPVPLALLDDRRVDAALAVPCICDGEVVAVLEVVAADRGSFDIDAVEIVGSLSSLIGRMVVVLGAVATPPIPADQDAFARLRLHDRSAYDHLELSVSRLLDGR